MKSFAFLLHGPAEVKKKKSLHEPEIGLKIKIDRQQTKDIEKLGDTFFPYLEVCDWTEPRIQAP